MQATSEVSNIEVPQISVLPNVALSIKQPWAWLIVRPDVTDPIKRSIMYARGLIKDVENRDWPTRFRGEFLVHTGKGFDADGYRELGEWCDMEILSNMPKPEEFERGGIIGKATIYDCVEDYESDWFFGEYGFLIRDAKPLPFIPYRGELGFSKVVLP